MTGALALSAVLLASAGGAQKAISLRSGAIGAVRVTAADASSYSVEVLFPLEELNGFSREDLYGKWSYDLKVPVKSPGTVTLFDEKGQVGTIAVGEFTIVFWCENDGGVHFRPTWVGKIQRERLSRALKPARAVDGIAAFAKVVGHANPVGAARLEHQMKIALEGALDHHGKIVAQVLTTPSDAGCGDDLTESLAIMLRTGRGDSELRCCGP